jgi:hypothetical protein
MRKLGVSRRQLFERLNQPALSSLPSKPFVNAEWCIRRVSLDYHVEIYAIERVEADCIYDCLGAVRTRADGGRIVGDSVGTSLKTRHIV